MDGNVFFFIIIIIKSIYFTHQTTTLFSHNLYRLKTQIVIITIFVLICALATRSTSISIACGQDAVSRSPGTRRWPNICYSIKPPSVYRFPIN